MSLAKLFDSQKGKGDSWKYKANAPREAAMTRVALAARCEEDKKVAPQRVQYCLGRMSAEFSGFKLNVSESEST